MMFSLTEYIIYANLCQQDSVDKDNRPCHRCSKRDRKLTTMCLDCKKAFYCTRLCKDMNLHLHEKLCKIYLSMNPAIVAINKAMQEYYQLYKENEADDS